MKIDWNGNKDLLSVGERAACERAAAGAPLGRVYLCPDDGTTLYVTISGQSPRIVGQMTDPAPQEVTTAEEEELQRRERELAAKRQAVEEEEEAVRRAKDRMRKRPRRGRGHNSEPTE